MKGELDLLILQFKIWRFLVKEPLDPLSIFCACTVASNHCHDKAFWLTMSTLLYSMEYNSDSPSVTFSGHNMAALPETEQTIPSNQFRQEPFLELPKRISIKVPETWSAEAVPRTGSHKNLSQQKWTNWHASEAHSVNWSNHGYNVSYRIHDSCTNGGPTTRASTLG